jgi:excisionase family DNA binding protein
LDAFCIDCYQTEEIMPKQRSAWYMELEEAAELLGIKRASIVQAISQNLFPMPTYKLGRRHVIDRAVFQAYIDRAVWPAVPIKRNIEGDEMTIPKAVRDYMSGLGKKGGKTKGAPKRRSAAHYARLAKAKREAAERRRLLDEDVT